MQRSTWRAGRARLLAAALTIVGITPLLIATPASAEAHCKTGWGSIDRSTLHETASALTAVRTGRHGCFERVVFDLSPGAPAGYWAGYTPLWTTDTGNTVPVHGENVLAIQFHAPSALSAKTGQYLVRPEALRQYHRLRSVVFGSAWQYSPYSTNIGIGVRGRLPFRIFTLDKPTAWSSTSP